MRYAVNAKIQSTLSGSEPVDMRWSTNTSEAGAIASVASLMTQASEDAWTRILSVTVEFKPEVGEQPPWKT